VPSVTVPLGEENPQGVQIIDALDDCDDVQNVYANRPDEVMAAVG
jgi:transcriptional/translational regulatory protein YebC/TACO1